MVLRKVIDKFRSRGEVLNKCSEEPDKSNSSKQQQDGSLKKKLKKVRSVKVADLDSLRKAPKKTGLLPLSKPPQQAESPEPPNYMKSTRSYDARKEKHQTNPTTKIKVSKISTTPATSKPLSSAARALVKNSSLKLLRSSMKKRTGKTSKSADVNEHALKVCPYTYCSLHGHKHGALPSLKRFLSTRRQTLKAKKTVKLRGYSSIKKKGDKEIVLVEDVVNELFIEIHSKLQAAQTLKQEWGEESRDDIEIENINYRMNKMMLEDPNDESHLPESCSVTSFEDFGDKNSELTMEEIQVINQFLEDIEKGSQEETGHLKSNVFLSHSPQGSVEEDWDILEAGCGERQKDLSKANLNKFADENNFKDDAVHRPKVKFGNWRRLSTKYRERVKEFNPQRRPKLLALPIEAELEQVNLKHQTVDERKAAEEWMIDYALRKALRRLTSQRKSKVPLLVAAFETVMPQMCETLLRVDAAGPVQTCSCK